MALSHTSADPACPSSTTFRLPSLRVAGAWRRNLWLDNLRTVETEPSADNAVQDPRAQAAAERHAEFLMRTMNEPLTPRSLSPAPGRLNAGQDFLPVRDTPPNVDVERYREDRRARHASRAGPSGSQSTFLSGSEDYRASEFQPERFRNEGGRPPSTSTRSTASPTASGRGIGPGSDRGRGRGPPSHGHGRGHTSFHVSAPPPVRTDRGGRAAGRRNGGREQPEWERREIPPRPQRRCHPCEIMGPLSPRGDGPPRLPEPVPVPAFYEGPSPGEIIQDELTQPSKQGAPKGLTLGGHTVMFATEGNKDRDLTSSAKAGNDSQEKVSDKPRKEHSGVAQKKDAAADTGQTGRSEEDKAAEELSSLGVGDAAPKRGVTTPGERELGRNVSPRTGLDPADAPVTGPLFDMDGPPREQDVAEVAVSEELPGFQCPDEIVKEIADQDKGEPTCGEKEGLDLASGEPLSARISTAIRRARNTLPEKSRPAVRCPGKLQPCRSKAAPEGHYSSLWPGDAHELVDRCVQFQLPQQAHEWLHFNDPDARITLTIDSMTEEVLPCLRHLYEFPYFLHGVTLECPGTLLQHPYVKPWLPVGKSKELGKETQVCCFLKTPKYHVSNKNPAVHYASLDLRVGGVMTRVLFDTGSTVSLVSADFIKELDIPLNSSDRIKLDGIAGFTTTLGTASLSVKVKNKLLPASCHVMKKFSPCYQILLGQDWMRENNWGIKFLLDKIQFSFGLEDQEIFMHRAYHDELSADKHSVHMGSSSATGAAARKAARIRSKKHARSSFLINSWGQYQRLKKDIRQGLVAYAVLLASDGEAAIPSEKDHPLIKAVIDKHSAPGKTLNGDVPVGATATGAECHISLEKDVRPIARRQFRLTPEEHRVLQEKVTDFAQRGWIEPSNSPWSSAVLFVPKPNGGIRFCVDYRFLNKVTIKDKNPLPCIVALLDAMKGSKYFTALDLLSGFYQIPLAMSSRDYTAFPTPWGQYRWKVMPMGLANAPGIFQQAMSQVLAEHIKQGYCLVYLDDVLIKSLTLELHAVHLDAVLTSLGGSSYFCQLPKCQFALTALTYLGFLVDGDGVKPDPKKVASLTKWQPPLKAVQQFSEATSSSARKAAQKSIAHTVRQYIGFMTFFARFIPRFAEVAKPLYEQMRDSPPEWNPDCEIAWDQLKRLLSAQVMMFHPDFSQPFHVYTDASVYAIGGTILQRHKPASQPEGLYPIAFCARKMTSAECNYCTTEQEMLAIVYCFQQWRCYLHGTDVLLHTDHEPLTWLQGQPRLSRRQARWMEFLSEFTYKVLHVPGEQNVVADALSRRLDLPDTAGMAPVRADAIPAVNFIRNAPPNGFLAARLFLVRHSEAGTVFATNKRVTRSETTARKRLRFADECGGEREPDPPEPSREPEQEPEGMLDQTSSERLFEELFDRIRDGLATDSESNTLQKQREHKLVVHRGLLWRQDPGKPDRLYVPAKDGLRDDVLFWHHDVPWAGHCGMERCLNMAAQQFYWPHMKDSVKSYIESCVSCATNKVDRRRMVPPLNPLVTPDSVWQTIGVDLITDLPPSARKHTAIVVFKCHLSKCTRLAPGFADMDAQAFAQIFFKEVFAHYGFPAKIVSDRGTQWNNDFFKALCAEAGIKLRLSTAYHPQTNGLVERTNAVIEATLRHYVAADQSDWDLQLPWVEFALNSSYHATLGTSPFALNRVCVPKNPLAAIWASDFNGSSSSVRSMGASKLSNQGKRTAIQAHEQLQWARKCVQTAKDRMKVIHDKRAAMPRDARWDFQPGCKVWFNIRNFSLRHPSRRNKLLPRYWGPFTVLERVGSHAVKLDFPATIKSWPVVSITLCKPFIPRAGQPAPVQIRGEDEYCVDAVVAHSITGDCISFCVKWKGSYEDSWHDPEDLENCQECLSDYLLTKLTRAERAKVAKALPASARKRLPAKVREFLSLK